MSYQKRNHLARCAWSLPLLGQGPARGLEQSQWFRATLPEARERLAQTDSLGQRTASPVPVSSALQNGSPRKGHCQGESQVDLSVLYLFFKLGNCSDNRVRQPGQRCIPGVTDKENARQGTFQVMQPPETHFPSRVEWAAPAGPLFLRFCPVPSKAVADQVNQISPAQAPAWPGG